MTSATKLAQITQIEKVLFAKPSHAYDPQHPDSIHDFMHSKVVVVDDALITGSHNFSLSAEHNAENAILVRRGRLADKYRAYIDRLVKKYGK